MALKYIDANTDIILNNDTDADRVGLAVPYNNSVYYFTGNETGMLVLDYLLKTRKYNENSIVATTIVSTPMIDNVKGVKIIKTLTGFKYIGNIMKNTDNFFFGFEESYGFLYSNKTHDKDGILASLLICEMASYYKAKKAI